MSKSFRSTISGAVTRIRAQIQSYPELGPLVDLNKSSEDNISKLHELHYQVLHEYHRISKSCDVITSWAQKWAEFNRSLKDDELRAEQELYDTYESGEKGFTKALLAGHEKLAEIKTTLAEIADTIARLNGRQAPTTSILPTTEMPEMSKPTVKPIGETTATNHSGARPTETQSEKALPVNQAKYGTMLSHEVYRQVDEKDFMGRYGQRNNDHYGSNHGLYDMWNQFNQEPTTDWPVTPPRNSNPYTHCHVPHQTEPHHEETHFTHAAPTVKLTLPHYNGDPLRWNEFWDQFEATVDSKRYRPVEKFMFLKQSLTGPAAEALAGIAVTNRNYQEALDIIKESFADDTALKRHLYNQWENLGLPKHYTITDLTRMVFKMDQVVRQLRNLGQDTTHQHLVFSLYKRLPARLLHDIEWQKQSMGIAEWSLWILRTAIKNSIKRQKDIAEYGPKHQPHDAYDTAENHHPTKHQFGKKLHQHQRPAYRQPTSTIATLAINAKNDQPHKQKPQPQCVYCEHEHWPDKCDSVSTVADRRAKLIKERRCFLCAKPGHTLAECKSPHFKCYHCKQTGKHHNSICPKLSKKIDARFMTAVLATEPVPVPIRQSRPTRPQPSKNTESPQQIRQAVNALPAQTNPWSTKPSIVRPKARCMLIESILCDPGGNKPARHASVYIDTGSDCTFILTELATKMKLPIIGQMCVALGVFNSEEEQYIDTNVVAGHLVMPDGTSELIEMCTVDKIITIDEPLSLSIDDVTFVTTNGIKLADGQGQTPSTNLKCRPDILIGSDYLFDMVLEAKNIRLPSGLMALPTRFGYVLGGAEREAGRSKKNPVIGLAIKVQQRDGQTELVLDSDCTPSIAKLWDYETMGITDNPHKDDDELATEIFDRTTVYENQKFSVDWPMKPNHPPLPTNRKLAEKRLEKQAERFHKEPEYFKLYRNVFREQLAAGVIESVPDEEKSDGLVHYLSHFGVYNPERKSTPLRVVMNTAAKMNRLAPCLNDCMFRGKVQLPNLAGLLIRFRLHAVTLISDIRKAFLNIGLNLSSRDVTRFLWFLNDELPTIINNVQAYRHCKVMFGAKPSPSLLGQTLIKLFKDQNTAIAMWIALHFYVDDFLASVSSEDKAIEVRELSSKICSEAAFTLCKWLSNSTQVMNNIPMAERGTETETKVLGIRYSTKTDKLQLAGADKIVPECRSKREAMQMAGKLFDPCGLAAPVTLPMKQFVQQLWMSKLHFDDELPEETQAKWKTIATNVMPLQTMTIDRFVGLNACDCELQLHSFGDASGGAYAGVVYLRLKHGENIKTVLVFARSRVAKQPAPTIPRLELMGMVIALRCLKYVESQLELPVSKRFVYTDSSACLSWLRSTKPLKTFVDNRITELKNADDVTYNYIPTELNPADHATRGLTAEELEHCELWWNAPPYLSTEETEWPEPKIPAVTPEVLDAIYAETKKEVDATTTAAVQTHVRSESLIEVKKFSTAEHLFTTTACVLKCIKKMVWNKLSENTKQKHSQLNLLMNEVSDTNGIDAETMKASRIYHDRLAQRNGFPLLFAQGNGKMSSKSRKLVSDLNLIVDDFGLLRCYGRMGNMDTTHASSAPKLMSKSAYYTKLIIREAHENCMHSLTPHTLSEVRKQYWITAGRQTVSRVIHQCLICQRHHGGSYPLPPMPDLPDHRVTKQQPFETTGIDYIGPFQTKNSKNEIEKVWVLLFTCSTTRAVHLEPVLGLTTREFLSGLRRFISRRGTPGTIISDNAPTFGAAGRILDAVWENVEDNPEITSYCATKGIKQKRIPAYAPWHGGFWEKLNSGIKKTFMKTLGKQMLTFEAFWTFTTEAEAILNCRPLTYQSKNSNNVLKPSHFLTLNGYIGTEEVQTDPNDPPYLQPNVNSPERLRELWASMQKMVSKFWDLWLKDYLLSLRERYQRLHKAQKNAAQCAPQINDVVIVEDKQLKRGQWRLAMIVKLVRSMDGNIRSARVEYANKRTSVRPINQLYPVETEQHKDTEPKEADYEDASDLDSETDEETVHVQRTNQPHDKDRPRTRLFTQLHPLTIIVAIIAILIRIASTQQCDPKAQLARIGSEECVLTGLVIYRQVDGNLCTLSTTCPKGNHLRSNGHCSSECLCPYWADECSFDYGSTPPTEGDTDTILENAKPAVCSMTPDPKCSVQATHSRFARIRLYNRTLHFVNNLKIMKKEPAVEDYSCFGRGEPTFGSERYCEHHECATKGPRYCIYTRKDVIYLVTDEGKVPIIEYGTVAVKYYGPKMKVIQLRTTCEDCDIECIKGGAKINLEEGEEDIGRIEVCTKPFCYQILQPKSSETVMFLPEVNLFTHDVSVKIWSKGKQVKYFKQQCPAEPYCEQIDCWMCYQLVTNPQCMPKFAIMILFLAI